MYKEYRELSRNDAVEALYSDMAARHRARFRSIHVCLRIWETTSWTHRTNFSNRSSASLRSRRPTTSSALTSSSSSARTFPSLFPTASARFPARRPSAPRDHPPLLRVFYVSETVGQVSAGVNYGLWKYQLHLLNKSEQRNELFFQN